MAEKKRRRGPRARGRGSGGIVVDVGRKWQDERSGERGLGVEEKLGRCVLWVWIATR